MKGYKDRSRKIAREMYWEENDRSSYECPDCSRTEDEVLGSFEVHHSGGQPLDNRPENLIALCRLCHNIREGKKPNVDRIEHLRDQLAERDSSEPSTHDALLGFVEYKMKEPPHEQWINPFELWWDLFVEYWDKEPEEITRLDLMDAIRKHSDYELEYDEDSESWVVWGAAV